MNRKYESYETGDGQNWCICATGAGEPQHTVGFFPKLTYTKEMMERITRMLNAEAERLIRQVVKVAKADINEALEQIQDEEE